MKIGTLTTGVGVVTTFNLTYLPEKIGYVAATQLTNLKVEVLGEGVVCDIPAAGLNLIGKLGKIGLPTNGYEITLADGKLLGKNVVITITNSAAQTPDIIAWGNNIGLGYVKTLQQKVFANTPTRFDRFAVLAAPSMGASDTLTVGYEDGLTEIHSRADLEFLSGDIQSTTGYVLHNLTGTVDSAEMVVTADQSVYIVKFGL